MLQNWSKTCKNEVPPKYMCKRETTNNWAEVKMVSDFDIKFMPLSKLNRGYNGYLRSANNIQI